MITYGLLLPDNYPKDNCPLTISPWKLPSRKIAVRIICCLHNCPEENCAPPWKIVPRINYTHYTFSQVSEIVVHLPTVASFCFPSLWFKLVLDFDFFIRKNFINTVRLKLLKKEEQVKNKLSIE